ncbi:MAG: hypothetical protein HGA35_01325 [Erysipelotrichaceae bacterium]|nr:hypothetical protein [Erysipelotrichaceae bacterium]
MKIIWVIGQMCSGKTTFSIKYGKKIGKIPFHLDHIRQDIPLVEAYKEAIQSGLIEGFTPHRNAEHLKAITEALEGHEVEYILIAPSYKQWKKNCLPIISCPTDENPPN